MLCFKLVCVVLVTWSIRALGQRLGPRVSGLLLGLPVSTALVLGLLGSEHGTEFAGQAAEQALLGQVAAAGMALAFGGVTLRSTRLLGTLAAAVIGFVLLAVPLGAIGAVNYSIKLSVAVLGLGVCCEVARRQLPLGRTVRCPSRGTIRGQLLRIVVPAVFVLGITTLAGLCGPQMVGLLGSFPATSLTVLLITRLEDGPRASIQVARVFPSGQFSTLAFVVAFQQTCPVYGLAAGITLSYLVALLVLVAVSVGQNSNAYRVQRAVSPASVQRTVTEIANGTPQIETLAA